MRFLGYNYGQHLFMSSRAQPLPPPAFRGEIRIPVRLHKWKPKKKYTKEHHASLRLESFALDVGVPPLKIKAELLGHYFEQDRDVDIELLITVEAWLMSPELLDTAKLEFSLTLVGEENKQGTQTFYASVVEGQESGGKAGVQLPVWSRTHISYNVNFKLDYDLAEFQRNVAATLRWHQERLNWYRQQLNLFDLDMLAQSDPAGFSYLEQVLPRDETPEILSSSLLEQLESAHYLHKDLRLLVQHYQSDLQRFLELNHNYKALYKHKKKEVRKHQDDQQQEVLSLTFQRRLELFQRVIKTYDEITLSKLADFLELKAGELEQWLLGISTSFDCFKIRNGKLIISHEDVDPSLLAELDEKFLEFDLFGRHGKVDATSQF